MALGRRKERQSDLFITADQIPSAVEISEEPLYPVLSHLGTMGLLIGYLELVPFERGPLREG